MYWFENIKREYGTTFSFLFVAISVLALFLCYKIIFGSNILLGTVQNACYQNADAFIVAEAKEGLMNRPQDTQELLSQFNIALNSTVYVTVKEEDTCKFYSDLSKTFVDPDNYTKFRLSSITFPKSGESFDIPCEEARNDLAKSKVNTFMASVNSNQSPGAMELGFYYFDDYEEEYHQKLSEIYIKYNVSGLDERNLKKVYSTVKVISKLQQAKHVFAQLRSSPYISAVNQGIVSICDCETGCGVTKSTFSIY
jgi:hypothetical protein